MHWNEGRVQNREQTELWYLHQGLHNLEQNVGSFKHSSKQPKINFDLISKFYTIFHSSPPNTLYLLMDTLIQFISWFLEKILYFYNVVIFSHFLLLL